MFNVLINCFMISCLVKLSKCDLLSIDQLDLDNILNVKVAAGVKEVQKLQKDIPIDTSLPKKIGLSKVREQQENFQKSTSFSNKKVTGLHEVREQQENVQTDTSFSNKKGLHEVREQQENVQTDTSFSNKKGLHEIQRLQQVRRLQEYIQIDTSVPENIEDAVYFWKLLAAELDLPFTVLRPAGLPICIITVQGTDPELPSIMLNSHADVVPAEEDLWTHPPFSGDIDDKGYLYGRGTQDCKSTGLQYLEAIRELRQQNITLDRTVYITVMPDEETGGSKGMVPFVKTKEFKSMNVGFVLDEGVPSSDDSLFAVYLDKRPWQMKFDIYGAGGHGSIMKGEGTVEQVQTLINTAMAYRNQQLKIMQSRAPTDFGCYSSCNINMICGGIRPNVVPSYMSVVIDVRLAVTEKVSQFQSMINSWMAQLGNNTKLEFLRKITSTKATAIDDSNPYWVAMQDTLGKLGLTVKPIVCPATTDMTEIRKLDIPAFGFTTNRNMPIKAHDVDEYIPVNTYLDGIKIYAVLIQSLANLPAC